MKNIMAQAKPSLKSRAEIEASAAAVLEKHGLNSIPIDPVTLANKEGIKVHNAKFSRPDISGMIARRGASTSLLVESDEAPLRKRFTIAHELGHFYLHLGDGGEFVDTPVDLHRDNPPEGGAMVQRSRVEVEANQFAAALLMPADHVRRMHASIKDVAQLAQIFRVSREAMAIRLGTLGLE